MFGLSQHRRADAGIGLPEFLVLNGHGTATAVQQRPRLEEIRSSHERTDIAPCPPMRLWLREGHPVDGRNRISHPQVRVCKQSPPIDALDDQQGSCPRRTLIVMAAILQVRGRDIQDAKVEADVLIRMGLGPGELLFGVVAKDLVDRSCRRR